MFVGIGNGIKSVWSAWHMRNLSIPGRLRYLREIARGSRAVVRPGNSFFRPTGRRFIWLNGSALDDLFRLAGGFSMN